MSPRREIHREAESGAEPPSELSHVAAGRSRMVDVGSKPATERFAEAAARVRFPAGVLARVLAGQGPKGPVTEVARVAGVLAAKKTSEWIPMCHPLPLDWIELEFEPSGDVLEIRCRTACTARTGVEMEALVGASAAALTVYDMTKALDPAIAIERVELLEKRGGKRGLWRNPRGPERRGP
jgi:cyclic pyranopterin monophosphate synthase